MQRYIKVDPNNIHDVFICLNRLYSFSWASIFGVIGARGYGKTYFIKRQCAKDFIFDNKKMVIIRDTVEACEKIAENKGIKFWGDVFQEKALQKHDYLIEGNTIKIDDKLAGEIMPLSTYYKYKGNYYDAENIFFDEFIPEEVQAYRGNRARQFANTIETIARDRRVRVHLSANALDLGNDILEALGIQIKNKQYGFYLNIEKHVVIYYAPDNKEFKERKRNSISGRITSGTFLDANMNNNEFEKGECDIFEKRKPCNLYGIYYNRENECLRLYVTNDGSEYYVCKDINANSYSYMRYVFETKQVTGNKKFAGKEIRDMLKNLLTSKRVKFESKYLFGVYCSIINNTLKK